MRIIMLDCIALSNGEAVWARSRGTRAKRGVIVSGMVGKENKS